MPRFLREEDRAQGWGGAVAVLAPVRLEEHAVDLLEIDDAGLVADGFDEGAQAEIAGAAQEMFPGPLPGRGLRRAAFSGAARTCPRLISVREPSGF